MFQCASKLSQSLEAKVVKTQEVLNRIGQNQSGASQSEDFGDICKRIGVVDNMLVVSREHRESQEFQVKEKMHSNTPITKQRRLFTIKRKASGHRRKRSL